MADEHRAAPKTEHHLNPNLLTASATIGPSIIRPPALYLQVCLKSFYIFIPLSTNLYASLWFWTKDTAEPKMVALTIAMLVSYDTTTKGGGLP